MVKNAILEIAVERLDIRRRTLLAVGGAAGALLSWHALADVSPAGATATIARFNDALLASMQTGAQTAFGRRFNALAPAVDQTFDLRAVLAVSIGPSWTNLLPDQQNRLLAEFRRYTVAMYVANFDSYTGQHFTVSPDARGLDGGRVVVQTRFTPMNGGETRLDYVMRPTSSGWKAVDVLAAGSISRVAVQRSDFRRILSQGGSDALLASLLRKTSDLSGGALE